MSILEDNQIFLGKNHGHELLADHVNLYFEQWTMHRSWWMLQVALSLSPSYRCFLNEAWKFSNFLLIIEELSLCLCNFWRTFNLSFIIRHIYVAQKSKIWKESNPYNYAYANYAIIRILQNNFLFYYDLIMPSLL